MGEEEGWSAAHLDAMMRQVEDRPSGLAKALAVKTRNISMYLDGGAVTAKSSTEILLPTPEY